MKKLLPILLLTVLVLSCKEDELTVTNQFLLPMPSVVPMINRGVLVSGGSFAVGYANGNIRSNRVTISWQQSQEPDFLAYRVLRNNYPVLTITNALTTSFTDLGLYQNTYYTFTVAVLNQKGLHRQDTITVKTPRFQTPTLTIQVLMDTTLMLLWDRTAESATSYRLDRSTNGSFFATLATVSDTFYNDRQVTNLSTYWYRITAFNAYESTPTSSAPSFQVRYQINAPSSSSSPQQLLPTRQVRVFWYDNSTAEGGFRLYRRRGLAGTYAQIGTAPANSTSYIDADSNALSFDSTYYYQVQAYNQRDTSSRVSIGSITLVRSLSRPTWVVRPPATMSTYTNYTVSWYVAHRTYNTRVYWYGAQVGNSSSQSGIGGTTYSSTLYFSTPGAYYIYASYWDSLNVRSYQTDTVVATVEGGGGTLLTEGFETGTIPSSWYTGGSAPWYATTASAYSGYYSARSGTIGHSQYSYLYTSLSFTGSRTISFWYRVSSEYSSDYLNFYVNGNQRGSWSGDTGWQYFTTSYTGSGTVNLEWDYIKSSSGSVGQDAAWIDNVIVQ